MAKATRKAYVLRALGAIASMLIATVLAAQPAFAATVTGADSYTNADQNQMTVLTVDGSAGESIFVRVTRNGEIIADRLMFTLDDSQGAVALDFSNTVPFDPSQTYVVTAFDSRDEANILYEGTIQPIYATLVGGGTQLIGVSTKGESDFGRSFVAPESLTVGENRVFTLNESEDGSYSYTPSDDAASVTGTLSYVTDDGSVVAQTTIDGITPTQSQSLAVSATVQDSEGNFYRVVRYSENVTLTYLANNATVRVKPAEAQTGYYVASIRLVAEDGTVLATDTLSVTKKYSYTAPTSISVASTNSTGRLRYETYVLVSEGAVTFQPGDTYSESGEAATFTYHKVTAEEATEPVVWTVVVENIAAEFTCDREIERTYYQVNPGETATYVVADNTYTDKDGNTLVPVGSSKDVTLSYEYGSGDNPVAHVYVAPETYDDPMEPYEVSVNYVDIATREVIRTETVNVSETNADTAIDFPSEFVEGGTTYVLLNGQEAFAHNYFSKTRTYTVYYRDVNDIAHADVVIRRTTTITLPGEDIFIDGGTTRTDGGVTVTSADAAVGAAGVGGSTDDGSTVVGALGEDTLAIDSGDGTATLTTLDGEDAETVRIDDQANPLAGPGAFGSAAAATSSSSVVALIGAMSAAFIAFVLFKKRRNAAQTESADTDGEVM